MTRRQFVTLLFTHENIRLNAKKQNIRLNAKKHMCKKFSLDYL